MAHTSISRTRRGFTLVELLAVIVIIGILSAGVFMLVRMASDKAAIAKTTAQVHAVASLVEEYRNLYGHYPRVVEDDCSPSAHCTSHHIQRSNSETPGYYPLDFTFKVRDGGSCKNCGNKPSDDGVTFGLCASFVPIATVMYNATEGSDMQNRFENAFKNPASQENDSWRKMFGENNLNNDITKMLESEAADQNLQALYRSWRRLQQDGMVSGNSGQGAYGTCVYCQTTTCSFNAEANDAWGKSLHYHMVGGAGEIVSAGPDGTFGTADDITSGGVAADDDDE